MTEEWVSRAEYNKDIKRIDTKCENQDREIKKLGEEVTELKSIWKILVDVPTKMDRIREEQIKISSTFTQILEKITDLSEDMKSQKEELETKIDEKVMGVEKISLENKEGLKKQSKKWNIALDEFITKNWFAIIVALVTLYMAVLKPIF